MFCELPGESEGIFLAVKENIQIKNIIFQIFFITDTPSLGLLRIIPIFDIGFQPVDYLRFETFLFSSILFVKLQEIFPFGISGRFMMGVR